MWTGYLMLYEPIRHVFNLFIGILTHVLYALHGVSFNKSLAQELNFMIQYIFESIVGVDWQREKITLTEDNKS